MTVMNLDKLEVWISAKAFALTIYREVVPCLPDVEKWNLAQQLRRAAQSIPANIAEGHGREHLGDYLHHLSVANGSLLELETHFLIANRLSYLSAGDLETILARTAEVGRMLAGLVRALKEKAA